VQQQDPAGAVEQQQDPAEVVEKGRDERWSGKGRQAGRCAGTGPRIRSPAPPKSSERARADRAVANAGWCSAWMAAATAGDGLGRRHNDGWAEGGKDPARWRWGRKPGRGRRRWGRAAGRVRASSEWERAAAAAPDRAPGRAGAVRASSDWGQCGRGARAPGPSWAYFGLWTPETRIQNGYVFPKNSEWCLDPFPRMLGQNSEYFEFDEELNMASIFGDH